MQVKVYVCVFLFLGINHEGVVIFNQYLTYFHFIL